MEGRGRAEGGPREGRGRAEGRERRKRQTKDICIYIYAWCIVKELQTGPMFAFYVLNIDPMFLFVFENLVLLAERRGLQKNIPKTTKTQLYVLKTGPICCATYLAQFLTYTWTSF